MRGTTKRTLTRRWDLSHSNNGRAWSDFCEALIRSVDRLVSHENNKYEFTDEVKELVKTYEAEKINES